MIIDRDGNEIAIGAKVRILWIEEEVLQQIPEKERKDVVSMIDAIADVYDIRGDFLCVEKSWDRGRGKIEYHMLSIKGENVRLERGEQDKNPSQNLILKRIAKLLGGEGFMCKQGNCPASGLGRGDYAASVSGSFSVVPGDNHESECGLFSFFLADKSRWECGGNYGVQ